MAEGSLKEAAFLLQQVAGRFYHCVLLVLSGYKPKTHSLSDLGRRGGGLDARLRDVFPHATSEERRLFELLKHAYIDARYSWHSSRDSIVKVASGVRITTGHR